MSLPGGPVQTSGTQAALGSQLSEVEFANLRIKLGPEGSGAALHGYRLTLEIQGSSDTELGSIRALNIPEARIAEVLAPLFHPQNLDDFFELRSGRILKRGLDGSDRQGVESNGQHKLVPSDRVRAFLDSVQESGGTFNSSFGIQASTIEENYQRFVGSARTDQDQVDLFVREGAKWKPFKRGIAKAVEDPERLVWVRVCTPLETTLAHEDKLVSIIQRIKEEHPELGKILELERKRGVELDLRIIDESQSRHVAVDKTKLLGLVGHGVFMSVVWGSADTQANLHRALQELSSNISISYAVEAMKFGRVMNEETLRILTQKAREIDLEVARMRRDFPKKEIDTERLEALEELTEELDSSAEYILNKSRDYVSALARLGQEIKDMRPEIQGKEKRLKAMAKELSDEALKEERKRLLSEIEDFRILQNGHRTLSDQSENVLEHAIGLGRDVEKIIKKIGEIYTEMQEARAEARELREERRREPEVFGVNVSTGTIPLVLALTAVSIWPQLNQPAVVLTGLASSLGLSTWLIIRSRK